MARRDHSLLDEIESDALDDSVSLATALRKCVSLGGRSGSTALRDWATRELKGYENGDELPCYRNIAAPLMLDGIAGNWQISREQISPMSLPDFAREKFKEEVELRDGVGAIAALLKQTDIRLMPAGASNLAMYMNMESVGPYRQINAIYWAVSHAAVEGVLDQIRTSLTQLVAELRSTMGSDEDVPTSAAADQAVNVVVNGKRARVSVNSAQAASGGEATTSVTPEQGPEPGFWTTSRRIGAVVVGIATVAGTVFGAIQAF